jgi:5-methylthioadenosine/S-adenosylhomocysteine deaminase
MKNLTLIRNGTLVTMDSQKRVLRGDLLIEGSRIRRLDRKIPHQQFPTAEVVDAQGQFVIPGLIQAHTHLVQCLFRGAADDLPLLDWLKNKIWPMEYHHNKTSVKASSELALLEMQLLGTTSILDMGTLHHTEQVFRAVEKSGIRYWGGKCLMDRKGASGPLYEARKQSLSETEELIEKWHQQKGRIHYALCPRFVPSCTERLLLDCKKLQDKYGCKIHTHASESREEIQLVRNLTGMENIEYLNHLGLLGPDTVLVHGVHIKAGELKIMLTTKTPLVHCPSANLKLASGVAPIHRYRNKGLIVGLGADGAPCNNTMDPFMEMRLAALIQKPLFGPEALNAEEAFRMATLGGAEVLGQSKEMGSLEEGKLADIVLVDRSHPSVANVDNAYSALVYSCSGRDVTNVWTHGKRTVRNGEHLMFNRQKVIKDAQRERTRLLMRVEASYGSKPKV